MHGPITTRPERIVVLTGAGISAESGVPTFRASDGLWEGHRVEDVATPQAFARQPDVVQAFYDARRAYLRRVEPNAAHLALARLGEVYGERLLVVTQNVDDLHERAGSTSVVHMHGELLSAWCRGCGDRHRWSEPLLEGPPCPTCGAAALRPDIVWFGEVPYRMEEIEAALIAADLFVSIGTSGAVYPAAGFVQIASAFGAHTVELNLDPSEGTAYFAEAHHGPASRLVPSWVDDVLA